MTEHYPPGKEPDFWDPYPANAGYRFALGRIGECTADSPPLVVIGMNPSHAKESESDKTVNHVIDVSAREHAGWLMLNLYPERSPKPKAVTSYDPLLSEKNCDAIEQALAKVGVTEVLGAWGNMGRSPTLKRARLDVLALLSRIGVRIFTMDDLLITGNPPHPYRPGQPLPMLGPKRYLA